MLANIFLLIRTTRAKYWKVTHSIEIIGWNAFYIGWIKCIPKWRCDMKSIDGKKGWLDIHVMPSSDLTYSDMKSNPVTPHTGATWHPVFRMDGWMDVMSLDVCAVAGCTVAGCPVPGLYVVSFVSMDFTSRHHNKFTKNQDKCGIAGSASYPLI